MPIQNTHPYKIYALGDSAATIDFGPVISEEIHHRVMYMHQWIMRHRFPGLLDCIPAYSTLTLTYNTALIKKSGRQGDTVFNWVKQQLELACAQAINPVSQSNYSTLHVPVCYEEPFGIDSNAVLKEKGISKEELIHLHTSKTYLVYMIGFLPGFPYMGVVDEKLMMSRKQEPIAVTAGSVGITGRQTGIYPFNSPGGWQIIGRTPLCLFDSQKELQPSLLRAGDRVRFYAIDAASFHRQSEY
jgi:inhibitor of KinA